MDETKFYGLLYIDEGNKNVNLRGDVNPIDVYISCASLCSSSFRARGTKFHLITNSEECVKRRLNALQLDDLVVVKHKFSLQVPKNIPFYSAHFKLDIFKAFGRGIFGHRTALIDLDTVCLHDIFHSDHIAAYDISDQMFAAYGMRNLVSGMENVSGRHFSDPRWYGGEFIMGSTSMFLCLSQYIELYWPTYIQTISSLSHVGDEMITSAALNAARADGVRTIDYGELGAVARWWTARTRHKQAPFDAVQDTALLHLPADKKFLAEQARYKFDREAFLLQFRRYARKKIMLRAAAGFGELFLRSPRKFTPRLSSA
jgi:hypothetical protein